MKQSNEKGTQVPTVAELNSAIKSIQSAMVAAQSWADHIDVPTDDAEQIKAVKILRDTRKELGGCAYMLGAMVHLIERKQIK